MSESSKSNHVHPEYTRKDDCEKAMSKFELALFGSNGRGGMVSDIKDIKAYTGLVRQVVIPIFIAVLSALLTAWSLKGFQI